VRRDAAGLGGLFAGVWLGGGGGGPLQVEKGFFPLNVVNSISFGGFSFLWAVLCGGMDHGNYYLRR